MICKYSITSTYREKAGILIENVNTYVLLWLPFGHLNSFQCMCVPPSHTQALTPTHTHKLPHTHLPHIHTHTKYKYTVLLKTHTYTILYFSLVLHSVVTLHIKCWALSHDNCLVIMPGILHARANFIV